jgi:hypothetical protein
MAIQAVLTADIVHSTQLLPLQEQRLMRRLKLVLAPYKFEFYRGDSFQVYIKDARLALETALLCRTAAIGMALDIKGFTPDVRISIGIGKAKEPAGALGTARGDAFVLSGRAFDKIAKNSARLIISTANELAGEGLQVVASYANAIFNSMTGKQANVIFELLNGNSQQAAAIKLKKSKSTISQHATAARWDEIRTLLRQYKNIINLIT